MCVCEERNKKALGTWMQRVQDEEKRPFPMKISATKPNTVKVLYHTRRGKGT